MNPINKKYKKLKILSIEDSIPDFEILKHLLDVGEIDFEMDRVENEKEFEKALSLHKYDIILSDFSLPGYGAFQALNKAIEICPEIPFIIVSGSIGEETAIDLIKKGAVDYILKDKPEKLPYSIKRALEEAKEKKERKQAELALIKAKEKAEESDRLKSAFLANMSHEIRTPMNGILGFTKLLSEPDLTGDQQEKYMQIIEKSGARMLNIINDIINISQIESGAMEVFLDDININTKLDEIYSLFKPDIKAKGINFTLNKTLADSEANVKTDGEKVYSILTNLIKNAIKYSEEGSIEFGYTSENKCMEFYVKDTGIGIPKDRQEVIFERFIQADIPNRKAIQGAGLGLSISKAYVEMLGGKIWIESSNSSGSTFCFTIPCQKESINLEKNVPEELVRLEAKAKKLKILIAEDDEISEEYISIMLKKFGKKIISVKNGIEAVAACRQNPDIDLVLMDIQMPELNGYEATQQIREFNKDVYIIAQTAYALRGDREKALEAGCNDYLTKPILACDLKDKINKFIELA